MSSIQIRNSNRRFKHGLHFQNKPKWIVVHYTGVANASASACEKSISTSDRICSTHFIVDDKEIVSCVPLSIIAYHIGNGKCKQPDKDIKPLTELSHIYVNDWRYDLAAKNHIIWKKQNDEFLGNRHSIGVDLCARKQSTKSKSATDLDWFFDDETIKNASRLIAFLCKNYKIDLNHVIRHADATGKPCPRPFVSLPNDCSFRGGMFYNNMWLVFKEMISKEIEEGVEIVGFRDDLESLARYENQ